MDTTHSNETLQSAPNQAVRLHALPYVWTEPRPADFQRAQPGWLGHAPDRTAVPAARPFYPFKWG